jgi:hypothetical protein
MWKPIFKPSIAPSCQGAYPVPEVDPTFEGDPVPDEDIPDPDEAIPVLDEDIPIPDAEPKRSSRAIGRSHFHIIYHSPFWCSFFKYTYSHPFLGLLHPTIV